MRAADKAERVLLALGRDHDGQLGHDEGRVAVAVEAEVERRRVKRSAAKVEKRRNLFKILPVIYVCRAGVRRSSDHFALRLFSLHDIDSDNRRLVFPPPDADVHARRIETAVIEVGREAANRLVDEKEAEWNRFILVRI